MHFQFVELLWVRFIHWSRILNQVQKWSWIFIQWSAVTVTPSGIVKSVTVTDCHCNSSYKMTHIWTVFFAVLKHFKIDPHQTYQKGAWKQLKAARSNNRSLSAESSLVGPKIGLLWFESSLVGPKISLLWFESLNLNHWIWIIGSLDHLK